MSPILRSPIFLRPPSHVPIPPTLFILPLLNRHVTHSVRLHRRVAPLVRTIIQLHLRSRRRPFRRQQEPAFQELHTPRKLLRTHHPIIPIHQVRSGPLGRRPNDLTVRRLVLPLRLRSLNALARFTSVDRAEDPKREVAERDSRHRDAVLRWLWSGDFHQLVHWR
jgi:hypothetical protein